MTPRHWNNNMKISIIGCLTLCSCGNQHNWEKISQNQYRNNNNIYTLLGDFDGDSVQDTAYLAKKDKNTALIVELSSKDFSDQFVIATFDNVDIKNSGIKLNEKKSMVFICTKDCEIKEQKKIAFDSIVFFERERSSSIFIYNNKKQFFDEFWLSD
jgi:hypothetical protein